MKHPDKVSLGFFPTPLTKLENLSKKFNYQLFIKRDDLTGLAFGGNKTRKLEYLIADALNQHSKAVVTIGAAQSNHARQTAAAAKKYGLDAHLLLFKPEPEQYDGNLLIDMLLGAKVHWVDRDNLYQQQLKILGALKDCYGQNPYFIPMGGSNETGIWGYIDAIDEIKTQIEMLGINIDYIVFASSSGGTQAGMIIGKKLFDLKAQLIGIEIDKNMYPDRSLEQHIITIAQYAIKEFDLPISVTLDDINLIKDYDSAGYGVVTELEKNAIYTMAETEGILLDPVYTGRAFGGLLDLMDKGYFPEGSSILFWHTGGQPALFAYKNDLFEKTEVGKDNLHIFND